MAQDIVSTKWIGDMAFEGEIDGHKIVMDALPEAGGKNRGARPKPLMLLALSGCTGMDIVSMLKKMRVAIESLNVIVKGDLTEDYPKHYHSMHVIYEIAGKNIPEDKVRKAVEMSEEKYCGVTAVYNKYVKMTSEIRIMES